MNKIRKTLGIAALCALTGLGGFGLGKLTSIVDQVTVHEETWSGGPLGSKNRIGYKIIKLHKPYAQDDLFVKQNEPAPRPWDAKYNFETFQSMENSLVNRYGQSIAEGMEEDIKDRIDRDEANPLYRPATRPPFRHPKGRDW